jgi:primosomal protein N' (replication factor Y)
MPEAPTAHMHAENPPPPSLILRIAVPSPLRRTYDYLPPDGTPATQLTPGMRLRVPFGRRRVVGVLLDVVSHTPIEQSRLKSVIDVLDSRAILPPSLLNLAKWACDYYHHPPGEVINHLLPGLLRQGCAAARQTYSVWHVTPAGMTVDPRSLINAPRQAALLRLLQQRPQGMDEEQLAGHYAHSPLRGLINKGWVVKHDAPRRAAEHPAGATTPPALNPAQADAVNQVTAVLDGFNAFLMEGVTGSGKTEVYLEIIQDVVRRGLQALVLLPEIGLTPQMIARFRSRLGVPVALYHSALTDRERLDTWVAAAGGEAPVILGTRSAVFVPVRRPGVIIIDEEHDLSYKQQEGFRYHARDVAVRRAQQEGIPVMLGSATPSTETLHNVQRGRYHHLTLPERAGTAAHPRLMLLDIRQRPLQSGLSEPLIKAVKYHLAQGNQVLIYLNRRGYAPTVLCHDCGWVGKCERCDAHLVVHHHEDILRCHHCGSEHPLPDHCPACHSTGLRLLGQGTERVEQALRRLFPDNEVVRIDRDSTRRKGAMQALLDKVHGGKPMILIGTQMLAKGHHLPEVTLVGIINADAGLFSADFRASERMAQSIVQVAGRAGRGEKRGTVVIQTHHPEHPLLQSLVNEGYRACAQSILDERRVSALPPYTSMALLRAESTRRDEPRDFLIAALHTAEQSAAPHVQLFGPVPAPMERRAGRYRAQLLIQAAQRNHLHRLLDDLIPRLETLPTARRVRWSLDVDPVELL